MKNRLAADPKQHTTDDDARIPLLSAEEMTPEQRHVYDAVVSGPRGRMIGPLLAAIHSPELAGLWSRFGEYLRFKTGLPARHSELAIIVAGRRWTSQVEWWIHARIGAEAGLPQAAIDAIRDLRPPLFDDPADLEVYEFARTLQMHGQVSDDTYAAVKRRWGTRGVVELTAVIGYYAMVAMTLNAHRIPVPDEHQPLPTPDGLVDLPAGRLAPASDLDGGS